MINMYLKDNRGELRHWTIWYELDELVITHGLHRGAMQEKRERVILKGKNTLIEQIQSRIASRISKMRDKGYVNSIQLAMVGKATNARGLPKPMLAQPSKKAKITGKYFVQYKYDGHRCIVFKKDDVMHAYSRNGKPIDTIPHILASLSHHINEGEFIDGELYIHGLSLQKIASLVKRKQADSDKLVYIIYDIMTDDDYAERLERLSRIPNRTGHMIAPTTVMGKIDGLALSTARSGGYEGLIVRLSDRGYEDGKRSMSLIKIKKFEDDEFLVTGIHASVDNWAILECRANNGKSFNVSAPGSIHQRSITLERSYEFIGEQVKVEYANLTKEGIPFHPVAISWHHSGLE